MFKVGDVVLLKSGGPKMTVSEIDEDSVFCRWFHNNRVQSACFAPEQLKKVEEEIEPA
jgi:uncharacterized protein YodC (DUF2158 family)